MFKHVIYDTHMERIDATLGLIMEQDSKAKTLFLVGHNFAISELASYLLGRDIGNMSTASIVGMTFDEKKWDNIAYGNGKMIFFENPKHLKKEGE